MNNYITVSSLCNLFLEPIIQKVNIYDVNTNTTVYSGYYSDISDPILLESIVESIDNLYGDDYLTINICLD